MGTRALGRALHGLIVFLLCLATAKEGFAADLILNGSGTVTCPALSGVKAHPSGKGCIMGGEFTFGSISLTNGAIIEVTPYDGSSTTSTGNLVLRATGTILIDESSRIVAKGAGFRGRKCDEGEAPALFPLAGGRGGCSVRDSGGGGAHIGRGGKGTRDCSTSGCTFPLHWEEDCGDLVSGACQNVADVGACYNGNATPDVSGQSYYHSLYQPYFGAAGGDKGCRDGDGQGTWDLRAGDGGGRIVLFAGNGTNTGLIDIRGRVQSDGFRGCSAQNDSAGGGAGGTVFIVGDEVRVGRYARISARGGRGGDSQPKALECAGGVAPSSLPTCVAAGTNNCDPDGGGPNAATNGDCITVGAYGLRCVSPTMHLGDLDPATLLTCVTPGASSCDPDGAGGRSATDGDCIHLGATLGARCLDRALRVAACGGGQVCRVFSDPWTGAPSTTAREYARCEPSTCTPCGPSDVCPSGHTCQTIGGDFNKVCLPTRTTAAPTCSTPGFNNCNPSTGAAGTGGDCIALGGYGNKCVPVNVPVCGYLEHADDERECRATQNTGQCDDCGGGAGGGIIAVQSRVSSLDPRAVFDVRGGAGGICPICAGEAGAGAGELQLDQAYVGEVCDGWDNDFDGQTDEGMPGLSCPDGSSLPSCVGGVPQSCPTVANCGGAVTDTRPRFAVIVDTSGSMLLDQNGYPTFGDGSAAYAGVAGTTSRLYMAKNALSNVMASFPESDYALGRYYQDTGVNRSCQTASWFECAKSCCTYDDPRDNVAPAYQLWYPDNTCNLAQLYPSAGGATSPLTALSSNINVGWPNNTDCINYSGSCGLPGRGAQFLVDFGESIDHHLMWLDHAETSFKPALDCATGDCELRATGPTPLAASLQAAKSFLAPRASCDAAKACRKYSVILLTDGAESCQGDPVAAAASLLTGAGGVSVKTYVIGFSVLPSEETQLNQIAVAGGTSQAYFVDNEDDLFNTVAGIVSSSYVFETCNDLDDDCDGLIDEGLGVYQECTGNGQCGSGTCNKGRCTCANNNQCATGHACSAGFCRPACAVGQGVCGKSGVKKCGAAPNECCAAGAGACTKLVPGTSSSETCNDLDDDCDGQIDEGLSCTCIPAAEVCNGVDDDCDGKVDSEDTNVIGVGEDCGLDLGRCKPGTWVCAAGDLDCQGEIGPIAETCNGVDDDCDGLTDGMSRECYSGPGGTAGVGQCRAGTQLCTAPPGGPESWGSCAGEVIPSTEKCNGLDDDCDSATDESHNGVDLGGSCCPDGVPCGVGVCKAGTLQCVGAGTACVGAIGPSNEICDGLDNDCNGQVDDLPGKGLPCLTEGGCGGVVACDPEAKELVCESNDELDPEVCDGLDNDCDGKIDEEPDVSESDPLVGVECDEPKAPQDKAPCKAGTTACVDGVIACDGSVKPGEEVCDFRDNDCDGEADVEAECPLAGNACVEGQCLAPCDSGEFPCPGGFVCDGDYCVPTQCGLVECPPNSPCKDGRCVPPSGSGGAGGAASGEGGTAGTSSSSGGASTAGAAGAANGPSGGGAVGTGGKNGSGAKPGSDETWGLATGGGGCSCSVPERRPRTEWLGLVLLGLVVALRRARREVV